jgi:uncharacterized protein (TIGR00299 family) protein
MALGSLVAAGADGDAVRSALRSLPFEGWDLTFSSVLRGGLTATRAEVTVTDPEGSRTASAILAMLDSASLPARARRRAAAVFTALATAEGAIHGIDPRDVHFHEVGGHDAIIDVVGTAVALELLDIDEIRSSPVALGTGTVGTEHGVVPNPPPAVVALLRGAPVTGRATTLELTTPTGAALLAALSSGFGPVPDLVLESSGYGAGAREIDGFPNVTQVLIGSTTSAAPTTGQPLIVIEANLDDATGEQIAVTVEALFAAGVLDAWVTPVTMKKGRPGHLLGALCDPATVAAARNVLLGEGGSFGVRIHGVERFATERSFSTVEIEGHPVRIKTNATRAKVEHDDAVRVAALIGVPVRNVAERALAAYLHPR